ncbi:M48 family metalloprotease, partial [Streptomyces sp. CBMA123]|uniref:M48 family metalloprotease n=1 Tax=Streptomyces sp. CBMA123 TaxID=1896313 RepID=UPI00294FFF15
MAGLALAALAALAVRTAHRRRRELHTARAALPTPGLRCDGDGYDSGYDNGGYSYGYDNGGYGYDGGETAADQHPDMRPRRASVRGARATQGARDSVRLLPDSTGPRPRTARWRQAPARLRQALERLRHPADHPLTVLDDDRADAFALPGRLRRPGRGGEPGRIVVTSGMLRALNGPERSALLAHERAHLTGRHHVFLALAEHAADLHPALRPLRAPLGYHLERWADEVAAAQVGDRA